jgi:hypothetical protein
MTALGLGRISELVIGATRLTVQQVSCRKAKVTTKLRGGSVAEVPVHVLILHLSFDSLTLTRTLRLLPTRARPQNLSFMLC